MFKKNKVSNGLNQDLKKGDIIGFKGHDILEMFGYFGIIGKCKKDIKASTPIYEKNEYLYPGRGVKLTESELEELTKLSKISSRYIYGS